MKKEELKPETTFTEDKPKPTENTLLQMVQYMNALDEAIAMSAEKNMGEIDMELEEKMLLVKEQALPDKVDGYSFILDALEFRRAFWKSKIDKLQLIVKAVDAHEEKLKKVLLLAMQQMQVTELNGNETRFKVMKSKPKVIIDNPDEIPSGHKEIVQTTTIKKDSIYEDLKSGLPVKGAHLEESSYVRRFMNTKGVKDGKRKEKLES